MNLNYENSISNIGDPIRIQRFFNKAKEGGEYNIGFIGGSITLGAGATNDTRSYAYLVYSWFVSKFPNSSFKYINSAIAGIGSIFGSSRIEKELLRKKPDMVFIDYSVNDEPDKIHEESFEGLIRRAYYYTTEPAMMVIHNCLYDSGMNSQVSHDRVCRHYNVPSVSAQSSIYPEIVSGREEAGKYFIDNIHPNDEGHKLLASIIINYLEKVYNMEYEPEEYIKKAIPVPSITTNVFEHAKRYRNHNTTPDIDRFYPDEIPQDFVTDVFKDGWMASARGASIKFKVEGSTIAVMYRKTNKRPAPVARLILDGDEINAKILDANFTEDWGDKLAVEMILDHGSDKIHTVDIEIIETHHNDVLPFYLNGLIVGRS